MAGKVVLITGATGGIGKETAYGLARMGATVIGVGRDPQKTEAVCVEIAAATQNHNVHFLNADLFSLAQVRRLAADVGRRYDRLDALINNAGSMFWDFGVSADGLERTFALNHLSHFVLTSALQKMLEASAPSRIVHVSSGAHYFAGSVSRAPRKSYHTWEAFTVYAESKLANILYSNELARRLEGTGVTSNALHPGFVRTGFGKGDAWYTSQSMALLQRVGAISPEQGALTSLYLAASPEVQGVSGKYFDKQRDVTPSRAALDEQAALRLWELSERLVASIAAGATQGIAPEH